MRKLLLVTGLLSCLLWAAAVRESVDPTNYALGARSIGMGATVVAVGDDANALQANPAALESIRKFQAGLSSYQLLNEYSFLNIVSVIPTDYGFFGVTFLNYGVGGIPETDFDYTSEKYMQTDTYDFAERVLGVTYALKSPWKIWSLKNLELGVTGKLAQSSLAGETLTGIGLDVGVRFVYDIPKLPYIGKIGDVNFGIAMQNVLPPQFIDPGDDPISDSAYQSNLRLGASKGFTLLEQDFILAGDIDNNGWHTGLEYIVDKALRLRGGLDDGNLTMGLGFRLFNFGGFDGKPYTLALDYAYRTFPEPLGNTHYMSLTILGVSKTKTPEIISNLDAARITANTISIGGTAAPNSDVSVYVNQRLRKTAKADARGIWNTDNIFLDNGQNSIYALAQYEQYVESDASNILTVYTDQTKPSLTTEITRDGEYLLIRAKVNKAVAAVTTTLPDGSRLTLKKTGAPNEWAGQWRIPPEYANAYANLNTTAIDELGNRSETVEDMHSTRFVNSPRDRTVTSEKMLYIRGTASRGAVRITAGGRSVTPDAETGRYVLPVDITQEGKNVLDVEMLDENGQTVTTSLRVLRVREASDLQGYTAAKNQITALLTIGALDTDKADQTKFNPADYMTRAEFAKSLAVIKGLPLNTRAVAADVPADNEYAPYIYAVLEAGYMTPLSEEGFAPNSFITRKAAVIAIVAMDGLNLGRVDTTRQIFADVPPYVPYAPQVAAALSAGIISPAENFYPDRELSRAEAATMLGASAEARARTNNLYNWKTGYGTQFEESNLSKLSAGDASLLSDVYVGGRLVTFGETDTENLKVISPQDEDITDKQIIEIKGLLKTGNEVLINGTAVPVQKGVFLAKLTLNDGRNIVRVEGGGVTKVLRVLYMPSFDDVPSTLDNLKYNATRQYAGYSNEDLDALQPITLGEAMRILLGIKGQTGDVSSTANLTYQEAVRMLNTWDGKPATSRAVMAGVPDPKRPLNKKEFIDLLANTDTYKSTLNRYRNFDAYEQENVPQPSGVEDRSDLILRAGNLGAAPDKKKITDDYQTFLGRYDSQRLTNVQAISRTGDSIVADGRTRLIVTAPQNNFRVNDAALVVRGYSGGDAEVRVNGRRVRAAPDNAFELNLNLELGRNNILVENTNGSIRLTGLRLLTYSDIQNLPERGLVEYLATLGYFKEDKEFFPDKDITREEAAALFVRMLNITPRQVFQDVFRDVPANRWSAASIRLLVDRGVIKDQNIFRPEEAITQQEAYDWFRQLSRAELQIAPGNKLPRREIVLWLFADERVRAEVDKLSS